jgi:formiminotetrahydrofolate cyclodeaminase
MDASGHVWTIATRIEETTEDERQKRLSDLQTASVAAARSPDESRYQKGSVSGNATNRELATNRP